MTLLQSDSTAVVDTLSQAFAEKWQAGAVSGNPVIEAWGSNDLIFVVMSVALAIWFVLLFFMVRLDRRISRLEAGSETSAP